MNFELRLNIFALFIFLGVCQGLFLSYFFLNKSARANKSNLYLGLFLLAASLTITEILLNYTGYMVKIIFLDNFSEPLNFALGPLFYLYIRWSIQEPPQKLNWLHFVPFIFYLIYCIFYFIQPNELKYNSHVWCYHPDWERLEVTTKISPDPLNLRTFINEIIFVHFITYISLSVYYLRKKYIESKLHFFSCKNNNLNIYRSYIIHFIIILIIFVITKTYFGRDLGDYFIASYTSVLLYVISYNVINKSISLKEDQNVLITKYNKSTLTDDQKNKILEDLTRLMQTEKYFKNNLASLDKVSVRINASKHNVSQVINEKLKKSYFELLAEYRINEAKELLANKDLNKVTIEEIAEMVGYNSKSAFNNSFKKLTGTTPAIYRDLN